MERINANLSSFDKIPQVRSNKGNSLKGDAANNNNIQFSG
jgi:hypothetical protein